MSTLVASGTRGNIDQISDYESKFEEGSKGSILLHCSTSFGIGTLSSGLNEALEAAGVKMPESVSHSGSTITIKFQKAFPWLAVIVAAIIAAAFLYVIIQNWELFKDVATAIAPLLPYLIVGIVILIALSFVSSKITTLKGGMQSFSKGP